MKDVSMNEQTIREKLNLNIFFYSFEKNSCNVRYNVLNLQQVRFFEKFYIIYSYPERRRDWPCDVSATTLFARYGANSKQTSNV